MKTRLRLAVLCATAAVSLGAAPPALAATGPSWGNAHELPSGAATQARSTSFGPWKPLPNKPFTAPWCNTRLSVTFPVSREEFRTRVDAGGNRIIEVRGRLVVQFTPVGTQRHYIFDISGESRGPFALVDYRNGDFLYGATGTNFLPLTPLQQRQTGLVRPVGGKYFDIAVILTQGPVRILFHGDPEQADVVTRPSSVIDVCRLVTS